MKAAVDADVDKKTSTVGSYDQEGLLAVLKWLGVKGFDKGTLVRRLEYYAKAERAKSLPT